MKLQKSLTLVGYGILFFLRAVKSIPQGSANCGLPPNLLEPGSPQKAKPSFMMALIEQHHREAEDPPEPTPPPPPPLPPMTPPPTVAPGDPVDLQKLTDNRQEVKKFMYPNGQPMGYNKLWADMGPGICEDLQGLIPARLVGMDIDATTCETACAAHQHCRAFNALIAEKEICVLYGDFTDKGKETAKWKLQEDIRDYKLVEGPRLLTPITATLTIQKIKCPTTCWRKVDTFTAPVGFGFESDPR